MSHNRLRLLLLLFFLALVIPTAVLVMHAYGQLKWEAFHQYRQLAEEVSRRIDQRLTRVLAAEEARGFTDYQFLVVQGEGRANFLQRSPLSGFPVKSDIPGLIGWFQVDTNGAFSTPLLPRATLPAERYGLSAASREQRTAVEAHIQSILSANRLVDGRLVDGRLADGRLVGGRQDGDSRDQAAAPREALRQRRPPAPADAMDAPLAELADRAAELKEVPGRNAPQGKAMSPPATDVVPFAPSAAPGSAPGPATGSSARIARGQKATAPQQLTQSAQAAFDELSSTDKPATRRKQALPGTLGRVDDLKLASPYVSAEEQQRQPAAAPSRRAVSKKREIRRELEVAAYAQSSQREADIRNGAVSKSDTRGSGAPAASEAPRILTFESELDPFEFSLLDSGHFVLYRKVWRDGQRYIQGALIEQKPFLSGLVETAFAGTALSRMSNLVVAWQGDVFAAFSGDAYRSSLSRSDELTGALLHRTRLSAPLAEMELVFSVTQLPAGPGASVIVWTAGVLALVLIIGVWLMYRLAARQLALARQQQDFVSAVSHELRTPITSIRMYAEMLREGWASEEKKRGYYEFIVQESERLSRLIANVLQLARMTRNDFAVQLQEIPVATLMDGVRSTLSSQVQHAGFELRLDVDEAANKAVLHVDADAFSQCLINLVDNALKFSAGATHKLVEVECHLDSGAQLSVTVRDYGPGVARDQMKKIFTLFYRSENELTRETVGTGIGLALVHQLMRAMHGSIDVANRDPGAIFTLRFPARAAPAEESPAC